MRALRACCAAVAVALAGTAVVAKPVDFATDVKPILEMNCVACHDAEHAEENGHYRIDTKAEAFKPHKKAQRISPGQPDDSQVYSMTVLPDTDDDHMPPSNKREPLTKEESETLKQWIQEGANWPEGVTLQVVMKVKFVRDIEPILEHGGLISDSAKELLRLWLAQGANWPVTVKFSSAKAPTATAAVTSES